MRCKLIGSKLKFKTWRKNSMTPCWVITRVSLSLMKKKPSIWLKSLWRMRWRQSPRVSTEIVLSILTINLFISCVLCQSWLTWRPTILRKRIGPSRLNTQWIRWRTVNYQWPIWHRLCCYSTWLRVVAVSVTFALSLLMKSKTTHHSNWPFWSLVSHVLALRCWVIWTKPFSRRKTPSVCRMNCHVCLIQKSQNTCN